MKFSMSLCLGLAIVFLGSVRTQEICNFDDDECVTRGGKKIYEAVVSEQEGLFGSADNLFLEKISGAAQSLNYDLTNITLTGMRNCELTSLTLNQKESSFKSNLYCPHLTVDFNYKASGSFGPATVDSEGTGTVTTDKYIIKITGKFGLSISEKDQKQHFTLESYEIDTDLQGKLAIDYKILGRKEDDQTTIAAKYVNKHYKEVEKYLRSPIIEKFFEVIMERGKILIRLFSADQVLPK